MTAGTPFESADTRDLEVFIETYEDACANGLPTTESLRSFAPRQSHPQYLEIVTELIRVDIERRWQYLGDSPLDVYREVFPEVVSDGGCLAEIDFELKRVGENQRLVAATNSDQRSQSRHLDQLATNLLRSAKKTNQELPKVGEHFENFELTEVLGQGAFGRVFLAKQKDLAERSVVLKITSGISVEADHLAKLQHTNIVPIYSSHRRDDLEAICMPMLGRRTLANVANLVQTEPARLLTGQSLISTLAGALAPTVADSITSADASSDTLSSQPASSMAIESTIPFAHLSYQDAIAWTMMRVAEGLSHAHSRGVYHLDLKPANILLSDDGEPRLLDFHIATDVKQVAAARSVAGGTLPYMSAEQMQAFVGHGMVDARADLFSLGVVFYQLLTGCLPFPQRSGPLEFTLSQLLADRQASPRDLLTISPNTSPGLAAIVAKCLAPLNGRYSSANELVEDLKRHLENLPLRYAENRSIGERIAKWRRRHPRLTSASSVLACSLLAICAIGYAWSQQYAARQRNDAQLHAQQLSRDLQDLRVLWLAKQSGAPIEQDQFEQVRAAASQHGLSGNQVLAWLTPLPPNDRAMALSQLQEFADLSNRILVDANAVPQSTQASVSSMTHTDSKLLRIPDKLIAMLDPKDDANLATQADRAFQLRRGVFDAIESNQFEEVQRLLPELVSLQPNDPSLSLLNATVAVREKQYREAELAYATFLALEPDLPRVRFLRGLARLDAKEFTAALEDFDSVIQSEPTWLAPRLNAALAAINANQKEEAKRRLDALIERHPNQVQALILRSRVRQQLGDAAGASHDRELALAKPGNSADELSQQGVELLAMNPREALDRFEKAIAKDPHHHTSLQNSAAILSQSAATLAASLKRMDAAVESSPADSVTRISRGVLRARMADRTGALQDVADSLKNSPAPLVIYQAGCIEALLSATEPVRRSNALKYLGQAFLLDASLIPIASTDPDLRQLWGDAPAATLLHSAMQVKSFADGQIVVAKSGPNTDNARNNAQDAESSSTSSAGAQP